MKVKLWDNANNSFIIHASAGNVTVIADGLEIAGVHQFFDWLEQNTDFNDWNEELKQRVREQFGKFIYFAF